MQSRLLDKLHGTGLPRALSYKSDFYVNQPDVKRVDIDLRNSAGATSISSSSGGGESVEFFIDSLDAVDPSSVAIYFKLTVAGSDSTALCNFAHSVIQKMTASFEGGEVIEDNQQYNVFCSMMYSFFNSNYVDKVLGAIGGYNATAANRIWVGKSFTLPVELGFFRTLKTYIPMFMLPRIKIAITLEGHVQSTVSGSASSTGTSVTLANPRLTYARMTLSDGYKDALRRKVAESGGYKLSYEAWVATNVISHPGSITGNVSYYITSLPNVRRAMFAQVLAANSNVLDKDGINSFSRNLLGTYSFRYGGEQFPASGPISTGSTSSDTALNNDASYALYWSQYSTGLLDRNEHGLPVTSGSSVTTAGTDPDSSLDIVYAFNFTPTLESLGVASPGTNCQLDLQLYYAASSAAAKIYVFVSSLRAIRLTPSGMGEVIRDQFA